ncbi:MAG: AAA family ATPase [Planctomycetes bacterium]|nr:AAA family ATPase [Planctomycetota bacterium]
MSDARTSDTYIPEAPNPEAPNPEARTPTRVAQTYWDPEITTTQESAADWILPGFIAGRNMTLLTSMWKAGKTTLLAHLLSRRHGGKTLFGLPVSPGKTVVISEEPRSLWADRCRRFEFGGRLCLIPQPFPHLPTAEEWRNLMTQVGQLRAAHDIDLLVVDSVTHFLRAESASRGVQDLLMPVRELTGRGMAALFMHHPRRCGATQGNAGRGHGAIHTEMDISIEMRHAGNNLDSRARRFFCMSRLAATPRHFQFELNADGLDYTVLGTTEDDGFQEHWDALRMVLEDAPQKLTQADILDEWPEDYAKPCLSSLWGWLKSAVEAGLIQVEGSGRKSDPRRYWVSVAEARWRENPLYELFEKQKREGKIRFMSLRAQKLAKRGDFDAGGDHGDRYGASSRVWPPGSPVE